jgi:hypothetical protein
MKLGKTSYQSIPLAPEEKDAIVETLKVCQRAYEIACQQERKQ